MKISPLVSATGALSAGGIVLVPFAVAQAPVHFPSWEVVGSLLALSIGRTSVGYVLYYGLLTGAGASRSILITYLSPAIALVYGALFLGERVTLVAVGGLALVLCGVALGTGVVRIARRRTVTQVGG